MAIKIYIDPQGDAHYNKPKVIVIGDRQYTPVSDARLIEAGWTISEKEIQETPEPAYAPTYEEVVVQHIRERYNVDDELAILRQRDTKPEEFAEYNTYCETCKAQAREEVSHD